MVTYTATVTVRPTGGVRNPEAETTRRALERLGFEIEDLATADRFDVGVEAESASEATARATEMAERLLANPTVHDYTVEVVER